MFMHMPKRIGIPVMIVVAACLAAYGWFVVAPVRVGDWAIYQGTGRLVTEMDREHVDISYTVRNPSKPLFRLRSARLVQFTRGVEGSLLPIRFSLGHRSEWRTTLRVVVYEEDGTAYAALLRIEHEDVWTLLCLGEEAFERVAGADDPGKRKHADFGRLRNIVDFYDGSDVAKPSTRFSNRLQIREISLSR